MLQSLWHGLLTSKACQPVVDIAKIKETETVSLVDFNDLTLFIEYANLMLTDVVTNVVVGRYTAM